MQYTTARQKESSKRAMVASIPLSADTTLGDASRSSHEKKAPTCNGAGPTTSRSRLALRELRLLGSRSGFASGRSRIGCSLSSRTGIRGSSRRSVGCSGCGFRSGGCRSSSRLDGHRSGCRSRSRLLLLAAGGQGSSSNQGGDDERLVHFSFSLRTIKKTKNATTSSLLQPGSALAECTPWEHVYNSVAELYWVFVNTGLHRALQELPLCCEQLTKH
jgi:hypothetical protein